MIDPVKSWKLHWIPTTFFLFGMLSIVLFLWIERIDEKLHNNHIIICAIKDIQIRTATFHLRLEESIDGYSSIDSKDIFDPLDRAIKLADVTLTGGETEYESISEPFKDQHLRDSATAIKSLLIKFKGYGLERLQNHEKTGIGSVIEHKFETAFKEILSKSKELENILEKDKARYRKKSRGLFLGILIVWTFIITAATIGIWRLESYRRGSEKALTEANDQLLFQAEELALHRVNLTGLVEKRTAELTTANKFLADEIAERKQAEELLRETEKQVKFISYRLLSAQENERRRISMELHDELGQALNAMKLQTRVIEKRLREDQIAIKKDCEDLLVYMDQVIENVRRLSLDLSPVVLEDIGLTSALRWLIRNLMKDPSVKITADIAEIDQLIPENYRIVIYRVVQEAITNMVKHAQAGQVSLFVRRHEDKVIFLIEDDGKGFDPEQTVIKEASKKGLGLTTMNERVTMMGGVFEIWSQEGEGTRITFSVPIGTGGN